MNELAINPRWQRTMEVIFNEEFNSVVGENPVIPRRWSMMCMESWVEDYEKRLVNTEGNGDSLNEELQKYKIKFAKAKESYIKFEGEDFK